MIRLLYFPNLIYYTKRNSLKWSLHVAPNRVKLEHEKRQRLVAELKERKSKGENLMIENAQIIVWHTPRKD